MMQKATIPKEEWEKPVAVGMLLEYTEGTILPAIEEIARRVVPEEVKKIVQMEMRKVVAEEMQEKTIGLEYNLKTYIDKKFDAHSTELFKRLERKEKMEKQFKEKVVDLFKRHNIGTSEELAFLDGLVSGS